MELTQFHTPLAADLELAGAKARLDNICKQLLSEKYILAWIMKACLAEYKSCTVQEIAEHYIEGTPQVASAALHPGQTNAASASTRITGTNTEDIALNEGIVFYDIRFFAIAPSSGDHIRLIINVEAQNKYHPGYPLLKRAIYYLSRLISAQYSTEFSHSDYGDLKKVYSIWVCMDPPADQRNTITQYSITEKDLVGHVQAPQQHYDLMTAIILCLGSSESTETPVLRLLNTLFSETEAPSLKKQILLEDFDIPMTEKLDEGVKSMCNYSDYVWEKAIHKGVQTGITQGITQGIAQGITQGLLLSIQNLMSTLHLSAAEAMAALNIPEADRPMYAARLAQ